MGLYIYSSDRHTVLGAYTEISIHQGAVRHSFYPGDNYVSNTIIRIYRLLQLARHPISDRYFNIQTEGFINNSKGFGHSDWCE
jgi:hypothetical protein